MDNIFDRNQVINCMKSAITESHSLLQILNGIVLHENVAIIHNGDKYSVIKSVNGKKHIFPLSEMI